LYVVRTALETPLNFTAGRDDYVVLLVRHGERLYRGCACQDARGQREQPSDLNMCECLAALDQPGACAERERGPLERELGDVGQGRGAVGSERGSDGYDVDGDAARHQRVGQPARELLTVRTRGSE
jgi:hypothetical protein